MAKRFAPPVENDIPLKGAARRAEMKRQLERKRIAEVNKGPFAPGLADPPFGHCGRLYRHQMRDFIIAMLPMIVTAAFVLWGARILIIPAVTVAVAVACEALMALALRRPVLRILNLNSVVVGLTLALLMPAGTPWWVLAAGAAAAVILGKTILVSETRPILNPALVGWLLIALIWPVYLQATQSPPDNEFVDALRLFREGGAAAIADIDLSILFTGKQLGGLGAADVRDVMLGGMFILYRRNVNWRILVAFFAGAGALAMVLWLINSEAYAGPFFHVYAGSFFFGAFFLIGDFGAAPIRTPQAVLYGLTAGALVVVLRSYGPFPDAVPPAILAVNALAYILRCLNTLARPKPQTAGQV